MIPAEYAILVQYALFAGAIGTGGTVFIFLAIYWNSKDEKDSD